MLPDPRIEPGVAAVGQRLVVIGGFDTDVSGGPRTTSRVDVLDAGSGAWSTFPDVPVAWTHVQLAGVGTQLYVLGGDAMGTTFVPEGQSYRLDTLDPSTGWQPLATMPGGSERGSAAVVVAPPGTQPGRVYLLGGASKTDALASCLYYDTIADMWGSLPDLPQPRSHPAAAIRADGTIVVAGGYAGLYADSYASDAWELPPGGTQWIAIAPMPHARGGCAYGVVQDRLVCAGGDGSTSVFTYVESLDLASVSPPGSPGTWSEDAMMPEARTGTQGAVIGARFYVPGGTRFPSTITSTYEPTSTVYVYDSLLDTPQP